ncbi:SH3 domain-containing kinase-binding protein 1 isoform X2 [Fundulus heteroclitus]|uniref:SH3 domain-containing kinase-binding protein 1 isoform X1 n=1 Tax=Fundulus heteroclitus TaxID=8078 RepID=UPI00165A4E93|nr:SH3 domain-containing kinase-binding protein 1 isoform X1 [Fundulus heteroclitus]XP_035999061.1 SH3 domain-containing kinase-binding protein 1 isoform X2 [Fundulus heteroclitus]
MGSYNSALIPDTEEFDSIVWEGLTEQRGPAADETLQSELRSLVTFMIEKERRENQTEAMNSSTHPESTQGASKNCSFLQATDKNMSNESFSSLLPKALSAVLHPAAPPALNSDPQPRSSEKNTKPDVEQLQSELRDLRDQFEQMKSQHNKEIKLLMNELDEEKRIRLTLQMEIQRMKKHMSK